MNDISDEEKNSQKRDLSQGSNDRTLHHLTGPIHTILDPIHHSISSFLNNPAPAPDYKSPTPDHIQHTPTPTPTPFYHSPAPVHHTPTPTNLVNSPIHHSPTPLPGHNDEGSIVYGEPFQVQGHFQKLNKPSSPTPNVYKDEKHVTPKRTLFTGLVTPVSIGPFNKQVFQINSVPIPHDVHPTLPPKLHLGVVHKVETPEHHPFHPPPAFHPDPHPAHPPPPLHPEPHPAQPPPPFHPDPHPAHPQPPVTLSPAFFGIDGLNEVPHNLLPQHNIQLDNPFSLPPQSFLDQPFTRPNHEVPHPHLSTIHDHEPQLPHGHPAPVLEGIYHEPNVQNSNGYTEPPVPANTAYFEPPVPIAGQFEHPNVTPNPVFLSHTNLPLHPDESYDPPPPHLPNNDYIPPLVNSHVPNALVGHHIPPVSPEPLVPHDHHHPPIHVPINVPLDDYQELTYTPPVYHPTLHPSNIQNPHHNIYDVFSVIEGIRAKPPKLVPTRKDVDPVADFTVKPSIPVGPSSPPIVKELPRRPKQPKPYQPYPRDVHHHHFHYITTVVPHHVSTPGPFQITPKPLHISHPGPHFPTTVAPVLHHPPPPAPTHISTPGPFHVTPEPHHLSHPGPHFASTVAPLHHPQPQPTLLPHLTPDQHLPPFTPSPQVHVTPVPHLGTILAPHLDKHHGFTPTHHPTTTVHPHHVSALPNIYKPTHSPHIPQHTTPTYDLPQVSALPALHGQHPVNPLPPVQHSVPHYNEHAFPAFQDHGPHGLHHGPALPDHHGPLDHHIDEHAFPPPLTPHVSALPNRPEFNGPLDHHIDEHAFHPPPTPHASALPNRPQVNGPLGHHIHEHTFPPTPTPHVSALPHLHHDNRVTTALAGFNSHVVPHFSTTSQPYYEPEAEPYIPHHSTPAPPPYSGPPFISDYAPGYTPRPHRPHVNTPAHFNPYGHSYGQDEIDLGLNHSDNPEVSSLPKSLYDQPYGYHDIEEGLNHSDHPEVSSLPASSGAYPHDLSNYGPDFPRPIRETSTPPPAYNPGEYKPTTYPEPHNYLEEPANQPHPTRQTAQFAPEESLTFTYPPFRRKSDTGDLQRRNQVNIDQDKKKAFQPRSQPFRRLSNGRDYNRRSQVNSPNDQKETMLQREPIPTSPKEFNRRRNVISPGIQEDTTPKAAVESSPHLQMAKNLHISHDGEPVRKRTQITTPVPHPQERCLK